MPKKYRADERARAVRMVREQVGEFGSVTKTCQAVSGRLGMSQETLRTWCRQEQIDSGVEPGVTLQETEQIRSLKARVRRLEEENAILKAAALSSRGRCNTHDSTQFLGRRGEVKGLSGARVQFRGDFVKI